MFTMARKVRKASVYVIIAAMIIMMLPTMALAASSSDLDGHWAKAPMEDWISKGLINGYPDGTFRPDHNITRAEFMALVNGAFHYEEPADIDYTDVAADAWYAGVIARAKAAGYIAGYSDGTMRPQNPITRQEAAAIIVRVKKLQENPGPADKFADTAGIPDWSRGAVGAVSAEGIMEGYPDGTFKAQNPIKRAEAVVALGKALDSATAEPARAFDQAGVYGPAEGTEVIGGNVIVNSGGVTLQNMTINGNLLLAESIGQGEVTLKNVTVKGTTDVQGGGENSIIVIDSALGKVTVSKKDGKIRIVLSGSSTVSQVLANSGVKLEEKDLKAGGFKEVVIDAGEDDKIILVGTFESVVVNTAGVNIELPKETTVETLVLEAKVSVTGQGTVQTAEVKASGVTFETAPQNTKISSGITAPVVGKTPANGGGGSGGGGGDPAPVDTPSISLEYLGHSAFIMTTAGQKILMDPFEPDSFPGFPAAYTIPNESSIDLITVSHHHADHNYVDAAPSVSQIVYGVTLNEEDRSLSFVQTITDEVYGDVSLSTVSLPHFEQNFPWGDEPNAGFIFETAGMRIVHPGDGFRGIIDGLTSNEIAALKGEKGIDILMLPVGDAMGGAHDSENLVLYIDKLKPKIIIPIHQWNAKGQFIAAASEQGWEIVSKPATVNFSKDQLPAAGPVIWDMAQTVDFRPLFQRAVIDGSELVITYNEALDENSVPAAEDFMVFVDAGPAAVNGVEVNGANVVLTLAEAVTSEDRVELVYIVGDSGIQDLAGNTADYLWGIEVRNDTAPGPVAVNQAPVATNVGISGTAKVGEVLTGNYTYTDNEGDAEGATLFQWYRKDYSFSTSEEIPGAIGETYTLTDADANKYIVFKVIPIAGAGTTAGAAVESEATGKVEDVLRISSASTFDRDGNGTVDAFLIFTTRSINDSKVKIDSILIDGEQATGFASGLTGNDDMFWIYFAENTHNSTKYVPELTASAGAFEAPDGESSRELTAGEDVERDGAYPVVSPPSAENTTETGTDIKLTSNETGTVYYVVLPAADAAPHDGQVKDGKDSTGEDAALKGNAPVTGDEEATLTITGLSQDTAYNVYIVAEDESGNVTFDVITISITTP